MTIRGILFDKDDTLLDLATFWLVPVRRTVDFILRELALSDDDALRHALERACGFDGAVLLGESPVVAGTNADLICACADVLRANGHAPLPPLFWQLCETYLEFSCLRDGICQPTADLPALFAKLRARGIKIGIATSDSHPSTCHALEAMGIRDAVDLVLTADRVDHPKPHPEMAERFCRTFGLAAKDVAMVGDSVNDMRFARAAGLTAILLDRHGVMPNADCDHRLTHLDALITDVLDAKA